MKFVCNNCGFAAEIPVRRTTCPMCGSSNVSFADEMSNPAEQPVENDENTSKGVRQPQGPTQRVTLTDDLIEKDEKTSKKTAQKVAEKGSKLPIIAVLAVLAAIAAAVFFLFI